MFPTPTISPERGREIIREITAGSETHLRFFALLIAASMIACFGLIANSTAVVIGAMLVSPLMTPIFGIALGLLRGRPRLLGRAATTEFCGVILAIGSAYLVGLTELTGGEATGEMLARTQPNLVDLFVAVFAGFAGAYALVDERISPALPGVAIATAIVPPLSTCGLCLALGAWTGAFGALFLFLANFVSILLVALVVFAMAGLARTHVKSGRSVVRRFSPAVVAFVIVAVILTQSLARIVNDRTVVRTIETTLVEELAADHGTDLDEFIHKSTEDGVQVLATVRSHHTIRPARVSAIQDSLERSLEIPVDLVVRTLRSRDVSPVGSSMQVQQPDLDGVFLTERANDLGSREVLATQVLREQFEGEPGFELTRLEYGSSNKGEGIVVAYVNAIRRFAADEIAAAEQNLQARCDDPNLVLLMRVNSAALKHRGGPVRVEWTNWSGATKSEVARLPEIEKIVRQSITELTETMPIHVHFNFEGGQRRILAEVAGPHPVLPQNVARVQERLAQEFGSSTEVNLWYRNEYIINEGGYTTYEELTDPELSKRRMLLRELFDPRNGTTAQNRADPKDMRVTMAND